MRFARPRSQPRPYRPANGGPTRRIQPRKWNVDWTTTIRPACGWLELLAQLEGIELDDATISAVVASLGSGPRPVALDRVRIDRQIRELALEHAAGRLEDAVYLDRLHELRDAKDNLERTSADGISPERAVEWLEAMSATWRAADVPAEKADLLHAIYDRITTCTIPIEGWDEWLAAARRLA